MNPIWKRPELPVRAPDRRLGGLMRSADRPQPGGGTIAGVPLQSVSDAVVATVQLGYRVADRQIDRGRRIAGSLRDAAARAGADDAEAWIEPTERLLKKAMAAGAEWVEGAATGADSPLRRLAQAELRLLARLLGLAERTGAQAAVPSPASPATAAPTAAPAILLASPEPEDRRAVRVLHAAWSALPAEPLPLWFHHRSVAGAGVLAGTLQRGADGDRLTLQTRRTHAPGAWRAAVCRADGLQLGSLDLEL